MLQRVTLDGSERAKQRPQLIVRGSPIIEVQSPQIAVGCAEQLRDASEKQRARSIIRLHGIQDQGFALLLLLLKQLQNQLLLLIAVVLRTLAHNVKSRLAALWR